MRNTLFYLEGGAMKEVIAVIRPGMWSRTKRALLDMGISSFTVTRVLGRGRQRGLHYLGNKGLKSGLHVLPKRMVWLWLEDSNVDPVVAAIMKANRTGEIGDGKIFVSSVEDALRVRTSEAGVPAIL
jgi:nitrogen regulatory protein PII 2